MDANCQPVAALPTPDESAPVAAHDGDYHRLILILAAGVLLAACVLQVRPDQRVELSLLPDWPFPEVCQSKRMLGWECPGCGLTRSFVHLAHGDIPASLAVHPLGWLIALFVALQFPYRVWALRTPGSAPLGERIPWVIAGTLVLLLIANWLARQLT
ncbi:MAG: DUF2752 domain-containing protein [Planctomycetaceae bacterium]|nr:DUF2752 domain-containing protein [Planctomycetaceae bacterium]